MQPDPKRIMDLACAFYDSCVLFSAIDTGLFAALAETGGADAKTLAEKLSCDTRGITLLSDAATALGLIEKTGDTYKNTLEASIFLVPGSPGDLSRAIRYNRDVYPAWGKLADLARTGKPVERPEIHLGEDAERTRAFVLAMHGRAMGIGMALVPNMDLKGCKQLLDIGGGPGTYSVLLAKANPELNSTVLDLPGVASIAAELIAFQNMSERVKTLPGDYHTTPFPAGNDAVAILGVLHQENPDSIKDILARAYESLNPGGVIYIMDMMTDATHTSPKFSAMFAVNMALTTQNGWVFSDAELSGWLTGAGFSGVEIRPLPPPMPHWLARAKKAA